MKDPLTNRARNLGTDPAYSSPSFVSPNGDIAWGATGLTKRELFAAMAMQGIMSDHTISADWDAYATMAVGAADALLKELSK